MPAALSTCCGCRRPVVRSRLVLYVLAAIRCLPDYGRYPGCLASRGPDRHPQPCRKAVKYQSLHVPPVTKPYRAIDLRRHAPQRREHSIVIPLSALLARWAVVQVTHLRPPFHQDRFHFSSIINEEINIDVFRDVLCHHPLYRQQPSFPPQIDVQAEFRIWTMFMSRSLSTGFVPDRDAGGRFPIIAAVMISAAPHDWQASRPPNRQCGALASGFGLPPNLPRTPAAAMAEAARHGDGAASSAYPACPCGASLLSQ